jgi:hypothetical protein
MWTEIVFEGATAGRAMEMAYALRADGLVLNKDFIWAWMPKDSIVVGGIEKWILDQKSDHWISGSGPGNLLSIEMELSMEKKISITDLDRHQVNLLEEMWSLNDVSDYEVWFEELSESDQLQVRTLQQILMHEFMEGLLEITGLAESREVLKRFRI